MNFTLPAPADLSPLDQIFVNAKALLLGFLPEPLVPWASILIRIGVIAALAPAIMMYLTWLERKIIARIQNRLGPDRVGIYGLMQPLSDGLKMLMKEDLVPRGADRLLHLLAPILAVSPAILLFAVIPFGRNMAPVDLNIGLLYILAVGSVSSYAIFMGGWASRSKFSVLGAARSVAQIISYEVPGVLSVIPVIMATGTLSLVGIVEAQADQWFVCTPWGFAGAIIFFLCGTAEVNRTPFDMPEAESELVGGFHTEYSGMKFALWYMAEFLESFAVCAFTTTLFLGGWHGPALPFWIVSLTGIALIGTAVRLPIAAKAFGIVGLAGMTVLFFRDPAPSWLWFFVKTYALIFVMVWFRGTLPRLRVDQLMGFAWKFLLPMTIFNVVSAGIWLTAGFPANFIGSTAVLIAGFWGLVKVNNSQPSQPDRTYVLAD